MVNFRMDGGAVGRLWTSSVAIGRQHGLGIQVFGENGGLRWSQEHPNQLYWMPLKRDQHEDEIHNSLFYEDYFLLKVRIERLNSPRVFSQQPPSYCQHVLQRPQITDVSDDACHTRTPFVYLESQLDEQIVLAGVAHHELVRQDAELKIRRKRIELLNREASLPSIQLLL